MPRRKRTEERKKGEPLQPSGTPLQPSGTLAPRAKPLVIHPPSRREEPKRKKKAVWPGPFYEFAYDLPLGYRRLVTDSLGYRKVCSTMGTELPLNQPSGTALQSSGAELSTNPLEITEFFPNQSSDNESLSAQPSDSVTASFQTLGTELSTFQPSGTGPSSIQPEKAAVSGKTPALMPLFTRNIPDKEHSATVLAPTLTTQVKENRREKERRAPSAFGHSPSAFGHSPSAFGHSGSPRKAFGYPPPIEEKESKAQG